MFANLTKLGHRHAPDAATAALAAGANHNPSAAAAVAAIQAAMPAQMIEVSQMPVERAIEALLAHALQLNASDLFITSAEQHTAIQVRHLGIVRPISVLRPDEGKRLIAHIRNASGTDVNERRKPADGRWIFRGQDTDAGDGDEVDLRINFLPTMYGEDVAMRLLVRGHAIFQMTELGMTPDQLSTYNATIESPSGLILITGPTGSGKTATLYASLAKLNDGKRKINTIEDPVEYAVEGLHQSQTNPAIELGFADLLRAVLRQSPDVIMIGEIRDDETAKIAVRAANSGILVLATLHAPDAASAVQSMRAFGVPNHFLAASLRGVVSQRLVRTLDMESRVAFDLTDAPHTFDDVRHLLGPDEGKALYAHVPTEKNHMTGYSGRTGVFEVMPSTKTLRTLIADGSPVEAIRQQARADGMLPFRHAALLNVARGITSAEELFRVIPTEQLVVDF
jgi:type II secretory ATPase GspE/PulE/Tfp pilus assembly ATPase PilB-like protein